jgi:RNA polymerase sigma-70 factor (ECF subfamily)
MRNQCGPLPRLRTPSVGSKRTPKSTAHSTAKHIDRGGSHLTHPNPSMLYAFDHQPIQNCVTVEQTDELLMARIQARDESALAILCRRYNAHLRTVLDRIVNNDHDVDCLLNDVFLNLWNHAGSYDRTKGRPLGWVIAMARHRAIDEVRRRRAYERKTERLRLATERDSAGVECRCGDGHAGANERAAILQRLLRSLPDGQREAVKLAYFEGLTQREVAARTGVPLGTIKTRLELGLRKLRAALIALGGVEEWSRTH